MKTLKLTTLLFAFLVLTLIACKKDDPDPANAPIKAEDLLGYQMYWLHGARDTINVNFLYFEKSGNDVQAVLHDVSSETKKVVEIEDNKLNLTLNDNGSIGYSFELSRKANGEISLDSTKYYNVFNPDFIVSPAVMSPSEGSFLSVRNKSFKSANDNKVIKFNPNSWLMSEYPNVIGTYTELGVGGWKGKINGQSYIGIVLRIEKPNIYYCAFQRLGSDGPVSYAQY